MQPLVERAIPWASTYGNHDEQYNLSREALFAEEHKYEYSLTQHSPTGVAGVTNYFLPIFGHDAPDKPAVILWFFDSRGGHSFQDQRNSTALPDWVSNSTVEWFYASKNYLHQKWGDLAPSIAFVHIPPTAFLGSQESLDCAKCTGRNASNNRPSHHFPGLNEDVPLGSEGNGWQDVPFMQALVDTPGLHSVYSGHDHGDSWCGNWQNTTSVNGISQPHLCFCKQTGYGGYGSWKRGSRVVELTFDKYNNKLNVETWVRIENGVVVQRVSLNATYGEDNYPSCNGEDDSC